VRWHADFTKDQDCFDKEDARGAHHILSPEDEHMLVGFILHQQALSAPCRFQDVHEFGTRQLDEEVFLDAGCYYCHANCISNLVARFRSVACAFFSQHQLVLSGQEHITALAKEGSFKVCGSKICSMDVTSIAQCTSTQRTLAVS